MPTEILKIPEISDFKTALRGYFAWCLRWNTLSVAELLMYIIFYFFLHMIAFLLKVIFTATYIRPCFQSLFNYVSLNGAVHWCSVQLSTGKHQITCGFLGFPDGWLYLVPGEHFILFYYSILFYTHFLFPYNFSFLVSIFYRFLPTGRTLIAVLLYIYVHFAEVLILYKYSSIIIIIIIIIYWKSSFFTIFWKMLP